MTVTMTMTITMRPLFFLLVLLPSTAQAYLAANRTSYVNVILPRSLHIPGGYAHQRAHFGDWYYSFNSENQNRIQEGSRTMTLQASPSNLCHPIGDLHHYIPNNAYFPPLALLANRTDSCSFVRQVRHAQQAGAAAVVLVNHLCHCHDQECSNHDSSSSACETSQPIVKDDGSGRDISIPAIMISKIHGAKMYETLILESQPVLVELEWLRPQSNQTHVEVWHTPGISDALLGDIWTLLSAFVNNNNEGDQVVVTTPHLWIQDGEQLGCVHQSTSSSCEDSCTNQGRYCVLPSDSRISNPLNIYIPGYQLVLESLRRLCIWEHYNGIGIADTVWRNYIAYVSKHCSGYFDAADGCIKSAYRHAKIDASTMEACFEDSGNPLGVHNHDDDNGDVINALLDSAIQGMEQHGIYQSPTILINSAPLDIRAVNNPAASNPTATPIQILLKAICRGFPQGEAPHVCYVCGGFSSSSCDDPISCVLQHPMKCSASKKHKNFPSPSSKKKTRKGHFWAIFAILMLSGICAVAYVQYQRLLQTHRYTLSESWFGEE